MSEVTRILEAIGDGDPQASAELLPLVYNELRKLATQRLAQEKPGQTLEATALVHEAYLMLLGPEGGDPRWNSRGHFFAAAAEAMRRILIESARRKQSEKRGGNWERQTWEDSRVGTVVDPDEILAVHEALYKLTEEDPELADVVKLRYFAGMTVPETACALGVSPSTVDRRWACARAWLFREIRR